MQSENADNRHCRVCKNKNLTQVPIPSNFKGVTSDCKPWPYAGRILLCPECGHIQKNIDTEWLQNVKNIYERYDIYHLSNGAEQVKFLQEFESPRSAEILKRLDETVSLPGIGALLDVGCGNGALLRSFSKQFPDWQMVGTEQNEGSRVHVESIPGVTRFHSGPLHEIGQTFDLITLLHVLEHIRDPVSVLESLGRMLTHGGLILAQIPNLLANPFDLVVTDHCSHHTSTSLLALAQHAGLDVVLMTRTWMPKETTILLKNFNGHYTGGVIAKDPADLFDAVLERCTWLTELIDHALTISQKTSLGVFGTAISGTWLANMLGESASFFVDEDESRVGKVHMGRPVYHPFDAPVQHPIYLAFPFPQASLLLGRLGASYPELNLVVPPRNSLSNMSMHY